MTTIEPYAEEAHFETDKASKYVAQLCKHFAHKVKTECNTTHGFAALPGSNAYMQAEAGLLKLWVISDTEDGLTRGKGIVEDHILRFAFREKLEALVWKECTPEQRPSFRSDRGLAQSNGAA